MIQFKTVVLHNFGSYGHTEVELQNRGFCLVSGQNNYSKDNAVSNGSGKSFLWSAICYALTGETIGGIKANLKNINIDESDCYTQVEFLYNKDFYKITRYAAPKSDLKVFKNEIDLSGKGIRESEKKLHDLLPDLTKDLIASTIIIGQGMPNKFSSFSPSGRKELLEKLTKSDFMIDDLKTRITTRQQELTSKVRELEDGLVANRTQLNLQLSQLDKLKNIVASSTRPDFDALIAEQIEYLDMLQKQIKKDTSRISILDTDIEELNKKLFSISDEKSKVNAEELAAYTASYNKLAGTKIEIDLNISNLQKEIARLKAVKDKCPTCGQKLPNVSKPDTSGLEAQLDAALIAKGDIEQEIMKCNTQHNEYLKQIDEAFSQEITDLTSKLADKKKELNDVRQDYTKLLSAQTEEEAKRAKYVYDKQNWEAAINAKKLEISELEAAVANLTNVIAVTSLAKDDYDQRIAIVKKMEQMIRRDFRGYLLTNIIDFIDAKAKEYCKTVFGTKELSICLNGNALDISYCGKSFDGLSGGEKQRIDLIIQLAIRDLLISYLDLSSNILVLDEITDFLDKKSCKAVMQLLEKELTTVESVFIISHHTEELEIPVDSEIKIIKNENGISELY